MMLPYLDLIELGKSRLQPTLLLGCLPVIIRCRNRSAVDKSAKVTLSEFPFQLGHVLPVSAVFAHSMSEDIRLRLSMYFLDFYH